MKGRVLSVASECVPLVKTGGLADVVGALPGALAGQGWQMRVMIPAYPGVVAQLDAPRVVWEVADLFGGPGRVLLGQCGALEVMVLEAPHLFARGGGPYSEGGRDFSDNAERFAALSWAAAQIAQAGDAEGWRAQVLHAHDWQAGLAPAYLRYAGAAVKTVMTVHNIAFQGHVVADRLAALRLPLSEFHPGGFEYWGNVSTLKAGLMTADAITTVSPRYAEELMRPEFGLGLEGVIAARAGVLHGILNGIDAEVWSPETDPEITPYSGRSLKGKADNRRALLEEFGLAEAPGPLVILVSRLTHQKGIDLIAPAIEPLLEAGGGLCVLGSGDTWAEAAMLGLAARYRGRVGVRIGYDEALSHRMFAGGDAVLVPSRFEPCGLTQLYGLRYGTLPVVAATGGLADTVIGATPATLAAAAATGVVFHPVDALGLRQALRRLGQLYADGKGWAAMQRRAMKADLGWQASAARYAAVYESLCD
ncbi:starch synthase [Rhodobacter veldkampii DSM 11550]|uniref:Glycogen synthase n=1 Tax=Phaeovulum veldkampii DSM 11550 TaxID=1185920 RepID=A0A2T4JJT2_9RHOB|nr:glycogen synthase GlgA [Phaeovulum veldkampii]MBK5945074.1 starch synthase [Phaeovulum veldkampii DSM 11550]PTE18142.1 glycogen synthase GlgA [Phaeovulum veldkampii DSM 11550]TDQ57102.1 starch synthase [Phaeovulum veldkampii DSM 11550]